MFTTGTEYRLDGIYKQRQDGFYMQRVKLPAGVISAEQAAVVSLVSARFGKGTIHLTTRGSMEIHWLREESLPAVKKHFTAVGLTSRGACGGAVRGVTCGSQGAAGFPQLESLARRLQLHFTGNPRFVRLPKKFKIGLEADATSRRHLIQDVGLVLSASNGAEPRYDVFVAGGLGREPQAGFLLEPGVSENRIIPLIEAIAAVYSEHTPAGKRSKHLVRDIGQDEFRARVARHPGAADELPPQSGLPGNTLATLDVPERRLETSHFAGELRAAELSQLSDFARIWADGYLMVTVDQNIAFHIPEGLDSAKASAALIQSGFQLRSDHEQVTFRVCPGTHECRAGLTPTRDCAGIILESMGPAAKSLTWAISGCHNSCTQPQLADAGIVSSSLVKDEQGNRVPRFDLYRLGVEGLGSIVERSLTMEELCRKVREIG